MQKTTNKSDAAGTESANGSKKFFSKKRLLVFLILGMVIGSFFGIRWLHYYLTHASTDDARIKGDLITISPTVQGKIRILAVQEGDQVKKGQLVAQLREEDYRASVDVAAGAVQAIKAALVEAEADLTLVRRKTQREIQQATAVLLASRARLNEARASLRLASLEFARISKLYKSKAVATSKMDQIRSTYDLAKARVTLAEEEIKENEAKLQVAKANTSQIVMKQGHVESLNGKLEEARATLDLAKLKLDHTTVTSPIDGIVAKKVAKLGEVVKPGQPIAVIVNLNHIWVEANLEESKIEHVRVGQAVDLSVDAYPSTQFFGKVVSIGAVAASEFALIPESRASGSFTKVTQRIPVKIEVVDPARQLRPGMMVVVGIDIHDAKDSLPAEPLTKKNK